MEEAGNGRAVVPTPYAAGEQESPDQMYVYSPLYCIIFSSESAGLLNLVM